VFIIHGRDPARFELAGFLAKLSIKPVIMEDESNRGDTLIEKLERELRRADFALAILTGDDEGHLAGHPDEKKPRARQNTILEIGLAIGMLGRNRVAVLFREGIELPSDLHGVTYLPFSRISDVKLSIVRELKSAGLDVDANKAFD